MMMMMMMMMLTISESLRSKKELLAMEIWSTPRSICSMHLRLSAAALIAISFAGLLHGSLGMEPLTQVFDLAPHFQLQSSNASISEARFEGNGRQILLSLDADAASGLQSYDEYLFGIFNMRIKLQAGDSAGVVTSYYLSSPGGEEHDELDFEFLGNVVGQPIILQTNHFASGVGGHEQRIFLWFDPAADFHEYTFLWNPYHVVFFVDQVPIRVYPNIEAVAGVPYLRSRPMRLLGTIWNGDSWATDGGRVKIDWARAPFTALYSDFSFDACSWSDSRGAGSCEWTRWWSRGPYVALNASQASSLQWVRENWMIYDYCWDRTRYNVTPPECYYSTSSASASPPSYSSASSPDGSPATIAPSSSSPSSSSPSSSSPSSSPPPPPPLSSDPVYASPSPALISPSPDSLSPMRADSLDELSSNKLQMSASLPASGSPPPPWSIAMLCALGSLLLLIHSRYCAGCTLLVFVS